MHRTVGMRFRQQVHEIAVEAPKGELGPADIDALVDRFEEQYERIYGKNTALRVSGVEFLVLRLEGTSPVVKPKPRRIAAEGKSNQPFARRPVYFSRLGFLDTAIYRFEDVAPGHKIAGPSITSSRWLLDTALFTHVGPVPAAALDWWAMGILTGLGLVAALAGLAAFARRDLAAA